MFVANDGSLAEKDGATDNKQTKKYRGRNDTNRWHPEGQCSKNKKDITCCLCYCEPP